MNRATVIAGIGGGVVALLLLAPVTGTALGKLERAQAARVEAEGLAKAGPGRQVALVAPGLRVSGGGEAEATATLGRQIRQVAAQGGVLVERATRVPAGGGLVRLKLRLSAPDKAVVALTDRIEREAPLVRFASWRVTTLAGGGLRLEGEAVAAWR